MHYAWVKHRKTRCTYGPGDMVEKIPPTNYLKPQSAQTLMSTSDKTHWLTDRRRLVCSMIHWGIRDNCLSNFLQFLRWQVDKNRFRDKFWDIKCDYEVWLCRCATLGSRSVDVWPAPLRLPLLWVTPIAWTVGAVQGLQHWWRSRVNDP